MLAITDIASVVDRENIIFLIRRVDLGLVNMTENYLWFDIYTGINQITMNKFISTK